MRSKRLKNFLLGLLIVWAAFAYPLAKHNADTWYSTYWSPVYGVQVMRAVPLATGNMPAAMCADQSGRWWPALREIHEGRPDVFVCFAGLRPRARQSIGKSAKF